MIESIGAGYIIGVMAHFYSRCNYPIIGAVLFGLGLLTKGENEWIKSLKLSTMNKNAKTTQ